MANKAALFYEGLNEAITNKIDSVSPFRAMVYAIVDGKVQIQMIGTDAPLDAPIARVEGFDLQVGDEVLVGRTNSGSLIVLGRIQRAASQGQTISATSSQAFAVNDASGETVFEIDTDPSDANNVKAVRVKGAYLEIFDENGVNNTSIYPNGKISTLTEIVAAKYNSPYVYAHDQENANVSSTTSTSQFYEALTATINLPAGTWDVSIDSACEFRHSAGGNLRFLTEIGGNQSLSFAPQFYSDSWGTGRMTLTFTGVSSGWQLIKFMYRSSTAGTSYAKNPKIFVIATRTS